MSLPLPLPLAVFVKSLPLVRLNRHPERSEGSLYFVVARFMSLLVSNSHIALQANEHKIWDRD
jgi:hypothetical protein